MRRSPTGLPSSNRAGKRRFCCHGRCGHFLGIGPKTAARLEPFSIKTIGDLLDPQWDQVLARMFGHRLSWIRELAQGRDHEPVIGDRESKSSSHETTFEQDTADPAFLEDVLRGFLRMLARDLRQEGLAAEGCTVKLKDARFAVTTRQRRFSHPLNYDPEMWPTVRQALHELMKPHTQYRLAGLALFSLVPIPAGPLRSTPAQGGPGHGRDHRQAWCSDRLGRRVMTMTTSLVRRRAASFYLSTQSV